MPISFEGTYLPSGATGGTSSLEGPARSREINEEIFNFTSLIFTEADLKHKPSLKSPHLCTADEF